MAGSNVAKAAPLRTSWQLDAAVPQQFVHTSVGSDLETVTFAPPSKVYPQCLKQAVIIKSGVAVLPQRLPGLGQRPLGKLVAGRIPTADRDRGGRDVATVVSHHGGSD